MYQLNEHEVEIIANDVKSAGINFSHLGYDLIDHLCCDTESRMTTGVSFHQAYNQVKDDFGIKGLQQIQINTLMLIDKNYRIMKNSMKTIGTIALALMAIGALFKLFHWPGGVYLLSVSFFFTSLVFYPTLLYVMYKEINKKTHTVLYLTALVGGVFFLVGVWFKLLHWPGAAWFLSLGMAIIGLILLPAILISRNKRTGISTGLLALGIVPVIAIIAGVLFKIQHWPGASSILVLGSLFLIVFFVPAYYFVEIRKSTNFRIDAIFGLIAITYLILLSSLLNLNMAHSSHSDPGALLNSNNQIATSLDKENDLLLSTCKDESMQELNEATDILCEKLDDLKIIIVKYNNEITQPEAQNKLRSKQVLAEPYSLVKFLQSEKTGIDYLSQTQKDIEAYIKTYHRITKNSSVKFNIDELFSLYEFSYENEPFKGFKFQAAFSALTHISFWQYQVQLAQNMQLIASINQTKTIEQ